MAVPQIKIAGCDQKLIALRMEGYIYGVSQFRGRGNFADAGLDASQQNAC